MAQNQLPQFPGYGAVVEIESGGFGSVYKAGQELLGREVAIKVIRAEHANKPEFVRRFEIEAQLIARLEHPHITPLYDYWRDPHGAYLVMRYLPGGSLKDKLKQGALAPDVVLAIIEQVGSALHFAHRHNVIHRDIKPGNILLDEDGNAYLADFGIAKVLDAVDADSQTDPNAVTGSLDYIAPEQARGEEVTARTDIYSLGVTVFELLTGEHPFKENNSVQRLFKHISDPLPELFGISDEFHDDLNDLIQKATAKDPSLRYSDVLGMLTDFRNSIHSGASTIDVNVGYSLTQRELEILHFLADFLTNGEIAQAISTSKENVKWHLGNLYKKLRVNNRTQAVLKARQLGLLNGEFGDDYADLQVVLDEDISLPDPENPYKGLHAFHMQDAEDFFGREKAVEKLLKRMEDGSRFERFLAVVGPSGSGKSSLVKAGLVPSIWKGSLPSSDKWFWVDFIPGSHPIEQLEIALTRVAANQSENINEHLRRDERGLLRIADLILPQDGSELLIVIDQFEEVFTQLNDEAERQHLLNLLYTASIDPRSRIRIIITLRADYYDRPLHYPEFGEMLRVRMETILPLTAQGLEKAIVAPAQKQGVTFEAGLVAQIVSEMNYQAGALPLLQYALTELFDRREGRILSHEAYKQIGGAVKALANRADEIYQGLTEEKQALARQMFLRLVTLGEGAEDTRRRTMLTELLSLTDSPDVMEEIIDTFADYRLLSLDRDEETRQPTVEVAHEAILREWERLRQWLNESREDIRLERNLAQKANEWDESRFDESYLMKGSLLDTFERWRSQTKVSLTPLEIDFIKESINSREYHKKAEYERKAREAEIAERADRFAEEADKFERRSKQFRQASYLLGFMVLFAVITTLTSLQSTNTAKNAQLQVEYDATSFALVFGRASILGEGGAVVLPQTLVPDPQNMVDFIPTQTQIAKLNLHEPVSQDAGDVDRVIVPAGCFWMGSVYDPNEQPVHEICFEEDYWIDRYEVTIGEYNRCVDAGACSELTGTNVVGNEMQPANRVTWFQAIDYCVWHGGRLPTEAEWEYAARGADSLKYPWGNDFIAENVVFVDNSGSKVATVGSRPEGASWVGAYDMSGNVWEWTSSILADYPYQTDIEHENIDDLESARILRGGSFVDSDSYLRTTYRYPLAPSHNPLSFFSSGMRCVQEIES